MHNLKCYISIIVILFGSNLFAQTNGGEISGRIYLSNSTPASFVNIKLKNAGISTIANRAGYFVLKQLPALEDSIFISGIGLIPFQKQIKLLSGQQLDLGWIQLNFDKNSLPNVEITGRTSNSYKSDYSYAATKTQTNLVNIPQSLSTVTKELINDRMQLHLNNALENIAGVTHFSGFEEYNIRGLHAENALLTNGLRTFNTFLTSPLLVNIERIELIKGPAAVLYGNCDPGGTINLVTKKPLQEKRYSMFIGGGSWNAFNGQVDATGPIGNSKLLYRLNAGYESSQSFRTGHFLKSYQIAPSFSYIPNNKLQINLDLSYSRINTVVDRGQPGLEETTNLLSTPISLSLIQPSDYLKENSLSTVLSATYQINKNISFNTSLLHYYTNQALSEHGIEDYITDDSAYLSYQYRKVRTNTNTFSNYLSFHFNNGEIKSQSLLGYDFINNTLNSNNWEGSLSMFGTEDPIVGTFSFLHPQYLNRAINSYDHVIDSSESDEIANGIYTTHGVYIQEYLTYRKVQFMMGLRAEFFTSGVGEEDDLTKVNKLLPRVGLTYTVANNTRIYANYNSGFDPFEPNSITQVFNQPFKPVTSNMLEIGIKNELLKNQIYSSLAIYQIHVNNLAVNANDISNPDLFVQIGKQQSRGLEAEIQGNLNKNLSFNTNYSFNQTEIIKSINTNEIGSIAANAPKHSSSSWLKYEIFKGSQSRWGISIGHSQVGKRNTLDTDFNLPGYCILNGGLHYGYKRLKLAVNINNILNETYWTAAYNNLQKWPGAPRNLMFRIYYSF